MMTPLRSKWAACEARGGSISESIRNRRATKQSVHFQRNPLGRGRLAVFPRCSLDPYEFRDGRFTRVWQPPMRVNLRGRASPSVAATVHEAKWYAQRNRCLEATGVRGLNAQSLSELRWRLRVQSRPIYGFDNMMDLGHTISLMDSRRYRRADPPSYVAAQGQPSDQLTNGGVVTIRETAH
jgi:hypothetical protein